MATSTDSGRTRATAAKILCALICSSIALLASVVPARADTQWTLNAIVTQSGGTVSGTFDIPFYTIDPTVLNTQVPLTNWNLTYTPAQSAFPINGGAAVSFTPNTVPIIGGIGGFPLPTNYIANYDPQNLSFPAPGMTSFLVFNSSNVNPTLFGGASFELFLPFSFLPNLGPNTPPINQAVCTTANSTAGNPGYVGLCDPNNATPGIGASSVLFTGLPNHQGLSDAVDPGSITGNWIVGTPGPNGGGGNPPPLPEPSTLLLLGTGIGVLAISKLRS